MTEFCFAYRLDPEPMEVGCSREQVRKFVPDWGFAEYDDLLELLVSELLTNALPHSNGPIDLRLSYDGSDPWIEVRDNSDEIPVRQFPGRADESGRGLQLIDGLIGIYEGVRGTVTQGSGVGKIVYVALRFSWG